MAVQASPSAPFSTSDDDGPTKIDISKATTQKELRYSGDDIAAFTLNDSSTSFSLSRTSQVVQHAADLAATTKFCSAEISTALPSSEGKRASIRINEQLTSVNRLQFDSLGLYGREKEEKALERALDNPTKSLTVIDGVSGVGKTSLAFSLKESVRGRKGLLVSGKFDYQLRDIPFSALIEACSGICSELLSEGGKNHSSTSDLVEIIREDLKHGLRENQRQLLGRLIPSLIKLFHEAEPRCLRPAFELRCSDASEIEYGSQESKNELIYAFQTFLRLISARFPCFVIILDDLQWADQASLSLLQSILTDRDDTKFLVVGLYRTEEVTNTHPVSACIRELREASEEYNISIEEHTIGNLGVEDTYDLLCALLSVNGDKSAYDLARLCHRRTEGNPFFLFAFLRVLHRNEILEFNLGLFNWVWDMERAEELGATDNIVGLLKEKMLTFPNGFHQFLLTAACLGSSFDSKLLEVVWTEFPFEENGKDPKFNDHLDLCVLEGFLEQRRSSSKYQWVHDKVQEAALTLPTRAPSLDSYKFEIGTILKRRLDDKQLHAHIFLIVNLINEGLATGSGDKAIELASLNLMAAQKASLVSAFASTAAYSKTGIKLLPKQSCWSDYRELTLKLHNLAAESSSYLGDAESMKLFTKEIISRSEISLIEKVRAYDLKTRNMMVNGQMVESQAMAMSVLESLGVQFPKNPFSIAVATIRAVLSVKKTITSIDGDTIMKIPVMTDYEQIEIMKLLERLIVISYLTKSELLPIMVWKSLKRTMIHGISKNSINGLLFGGAIVTAAFKDYNTVAALGEAFLKTGNSGIVQREAQVLFGAYTLLLPWKLPIKGFLKPLMAAYQRGLESGDTEAAMWVRTLNTVYSWTFLPGVCGFVSP